MSASEEEQEPDKVAEFSEEQVIEWLKDSRKKELLIKKLGINDPEASRSKTTAGVPTDKESSSLSGKESASDGSNQHLTLSGKYAGGWAMLPPPFFAGWPWMGMAPFSGAPQTTSCMPAPWQWRARSECKSFYFQWSWNECFYFQ